jgi:hypothetical protein
VYCSSEIDPNTRTAIVLRRPPDLVRTATWPTNWIASLNVPAVQLAIQLCPDVFQFAFELAAAYACRRNGLSGPGRQSVTSQRKSKCAHSLCRLPKTAPALDDVV